MVLRGPWPSRPKLKGSKARGLRYERKFGRELRRRCLREGDDLRPGQWFKFVDENGPGYAQSDVLFLRGHCLFIFECKLTYRPEGWDQLNFLYSPLCAAVWPGLRQRLVLVCHSLGGFDPSTSCGAVEVAALDDVLGPSESSSPEPPRFLLHWLGI